MNILFPGTFFSSLKYSFPQKLYIQDQKLGAKKTQEVLVKYAV